MTSYKEGIFRAKSIDIFESNTSLSKNVAKDTYKQHVMDLSTLMTLQFIESFDKSAYACDRSVITFTFAHGKVQTIVVHDPQYKVIKDNYINSFKQRLFQTFLGHSFDTCHVRYILVKNGKVIGEVCEHAVEGKVMFRCYFAGYSWDTNEEYVDTDIKDPLVDDMYDDKELSGDSELLQSLEIDFDLQSMSNICTKRRVRSFDLVRRSVPF